MGYPRVSWICHGSTARQSWVVHDNARATIKAPNIYVYIGHADNVCYSYISHTVRFTVPCFGNPWVALDLMSLPVGRP